MGEPQNTRVILLACGTFNPVTKGHLAMFERASAHLSSIGSLHVIGGLIAPSHDACGQSTLLSSHHRLTMCHLAVRTSKWIRVDPWACLQQNSQSPRAVLEHHRTLLKQMSGCIFSDVGTPTDYQPGIIRQPSLPIQHSLSPSKPTPGKIMSKIGDDIGHVCCYRTRMQPFTFVDENANMGTVFRYEELDIRVMLLCGSDTLLSFCIPGLWAAPDVKVILGDFGVVCVPREGRDPNCIINASPLLSKYKHNIIVVGMDSDLETSFVSSTKSRRAVQCGDASVPRLLSQPVIDYILQQRLYMQSTSG
uniref:nicotinamide/nicotinic acid mononucleotide adenylyltransferase 2-like isoform X2 n=1 Tax=Myxine glutinosa TaxID=7769 RepID=UPI00358FC6CE